MRGRLFLIGTILLAWLLLIPVTAAQTVELTVYYSPTCSHCQMVREQVLPPLSQNYGDRLVLHEIDVSQPEGLAQLEAVEERLGQRNNPLPVIQLGDQLIANEDLFALQDALTQTLLERLGDPGQATSANTPETSATNTGEKTDSELTAIIHVAYVEKEGCSNCA